MGVVIVLGGKQAWLKLKSLWYKYKMRKSKNNAVRDTPKPIEG
jgi:hypothetical protein